VRRLLFSPSWVLRHLLAIFLIGLFIRLGWWQLVKGNSERGTLQNLFYGIEWPIFAATVAFFWWKMVREELRPSGGPAPVTEPGTIAPTAAVPPGATGAQGVAGTPGVAGGAGAGSGSGAATGSGTGHGAGETETDIDSDDDEDRELAAYNRYLASLYESDARGTRR
jgi:hypothetical protein